MSSREYMEMRAFTVRHNGGELFYSGTLTTMHMYSIRRVFMKCLGARNVIVKRVDAFQWEAYLTNKPRHKYVLWVDPTVIERVPVARGYMVAVCEKCGEKFTTKEDEPVTRCLGCREEIARPRRSRGRRCHDCGRPTCNYRCDKCWEKLRREGGYIIFPDSEYEGDEDD